MSIVAGTGDPGLIDDFEDGNSVVLPNDGRAGPGWWFSKSMTSTTTQPAASGAGVPVDGGMPGKALHVAGTEGGMGNNAWGADITATIVADGMTGCYDASAYTGLKVSLKGKAGSKVFVLVGTAPIRAISSMAGHYRKEVTLTADWQDVTIPWAMFGPGWGTPPSPMVNPKEVYTVGVATAPGAGGMVGEFDFWIDNLAFYK
jgi:hypothetical protein